MQNNLIFETFNIGKQYGNHKVLKDISIEIEAGKIVGLVGENGAGKSTLLKILSGVERPTEGKMRVNGKDYSPHNPLEANHMGVGMVFQEQSLTLNLTVGQNINLGKEEKYKKFGLIDWKKMYTDIDEYLKSLDIHNISPSKKVQDYMFSDRQMIEIARVLKTVRDSNADKKLILLDEPTSVLNESEIQKLFGYMRKLRNDSNSIIFVSHRLDEILEICDLIYVFKDGEQVGKLSREEANEKLLYQLMVGSSTNGEYYQVHEQCVPEKEVVLEFDKIGLRGACKDVSFRLHKGEILSICGVTGSGKEEVCAIACGDISYSTGTMMVKGTPVIWNEPYQALQAGILSVPKERRLEAICDNLGINDNIVLSNYKITKKGAFLSAKKKNEISEHIIQQINIKCNSPKDEVGNLSGGNAQKVVFGRAMVSGADILILNHPTRGVDVGAKTEIYNLIRQMTKQGKSVLLLGDTLEECIGLSNRVLVMKDGVVTHEFEAGADCKPSQFDLIQYMM